MNAAARHRLHGPVKHLPGGRLPSVAVRTGRLLAREQKPQRRHVGKLGCAPDAARVPVLRGEQLLLQRAAQRLRIRARLRLRGKRRARELIRPGQDARAVLLP